MRYILASKSPRRKDLMKFISSDFLVAVEDINEDISYNLSPIDAVKDIALRKGEAVYQSFPSDLVISADTIVVIDNKIIRKPTDEKDWQGEPPTSKSTFPRKSLPSSSFMS